MESAIRLAGAMPAEGPLALLLDFDGTLAEIVPQPDDARARPEALAAMARLLREENVSIAIVSGRALDDLAARVPVSRCWLVGAHGGELLTPDGRREQLVDPERVRPGIERFLLHARELSARFGFRVEDKGVAAAAHLGHLSADECCRVFMSLMGHAETLARDWDVAWITGKEVIELRGKNATKATAVSALLTRWRADVSVVAMGDDTTDEDMFRAIALRGGLTVKVGAGPTSAAHRLDTPADVGLWLETLAAHREERKHVRTAREAGPPGRMTGC